MLCGWGVVSAVLYGALMDFAFWPYNVGAGTGLSWDADAGLAHNLHTFVLFELATGMGWNVGRAVTNTVAIIVVGPGVLRVLRRAVRLRVDRLEEGPRLLRRFSPPVPGPSPALWRDGAAAPAAEHGVEPAGEFLVGRPAVARGQCPRQVRMARSVRGLERLSLIHISEPTRH